MKDRKLRIKVKDLRKLIREGKWNLSTSMRSVLTEELPNTKATDANMLENDSLDAQLDHFLLQADKSKTDAGAAQAESFLREAGEDDDAAGGEETQAAPATPPAQTDPGKELDCVSFADDVARLVEKHENLLDIRGTIVRRALNYVSKNYDAKQMKEVQQVLEGNFELTPEDHPDKYDDGENQPPPAKGAGPGLNG